MIPFLGEHQYYQCAKVNGKSVAVSFQPGGNQPKISTGDGALELYVPPIYREFMKECVIQLEILHCNSCRTNSSQAAGSMNTNPGRLTKPEWQKDVLRTIRSRGLRVPPNWVTLLDKVNAKSPLNEHEIAALSYIWLILKTQEFDLKLDPDTDLYQRYLVIPPSPMDLMYTVLCSYSIETENFDSLVKCLPEICLEGIVLGDKLLGVDVSRNKKRSLERLFGPFNLLRCLGSKHLCVFPFNMDETLANRLHSLVVAALPQNTIQAAGLLVRKELFDLKSCWMGDDRKKKEHSGWPTAAVPSPPPKKIDFACIDGNS